VLTSSSVYASNLNESTPIADLTVSLREVFLEFGTIIDVVAKKSLRRKGQAFIVFDTAENAANAIEYLQDFELFDKPMKLAFARTRSDATVLAAGDSAAFEAHKAARLAEKERKNAAEAAAQAQLEAQNKLKRRVPSDEPVLAPSGLKKAKGLKSTNAAASIMPDEFLPPNKVLFLQNLPPPDEYGHDDLVGLFGRFPGMVEIRMIEAKPGIAFAEFQTPEQATPAKDRLNGMKLGFAEKVMKITFQRS
jgi:RNA recognition motif-containing protein